MAQAGGRVMGMVGRGERLVKGLVTWGTPRATRMWSVAKVELLPPSPAEIPQITKEANQLWRSLWTKKFLNTSVKDATINAAITLEVVMWFFIGECIGKGSIVGYNIPGAVHHHSAF